MIVGCEQRLAANFPGDVFHHGAGNAHAVKGGGSAADLVQNHQTFRGGVLQDLRNLGHLHHKRGLARRQIIGGANPGENGVHHAHFAGFCRHKAADLRHQRNQRVLPHVGGFTCHVRAGEQNGAVFAAVHFGIIGHKQAALQHLLNHRVAALFNHQHIAVVHLWLYVIVVAGHLRQGRVHVQLRHSHGGGLNAHQLIRHGAEQLVKQLPLQGEHPLIGTQNFVFQLLQVVRDVALRIG